MDKYLTGIKVPDWVKWIAVDKDGSEYGYKFKPHYSRVFGSWTNRHTEYTNPIEWCFIGVGKPPKNWKEELYTWDYE